MFRSRKVQRIYMVIADAGHRQTCASSSTQGGKPTQCQFAVAGNISGQRTGVAITDLESRAISSHVDGHALNLTASGMLKQCAV